MRINCIGYNETNELQLSSKNNSHLFQDHQRRKFLKLGRGDVSEGAYHVQRLVEAVIAGDGDVGQLLVVVDDPAWIVAPQLRQHLAQRAVLEHQSALNPRQVGGDRKSTRLNSSHL